MNHDCNECYFYNVYHGVCQRKGKDFEPRRGYDEACELFKLDPLAEEFLEEKE